MNISKMAKDPMKPVFPESLTRLQEADPEVFGIIKDEEQRQWCAPRPAVYGTRQVVTIISRNVVGRRGLPSMCSTNHASLLAGRASS